MLENENEEALRIKLEKSNIKNILQHVIFSMASQDIRFYLNGLLSKLNKIIFFLLLTDGHRYLFTMLLIMKITKRFQLSFQEKQY